MDYVVIGGDERFAHLARMLADRGRRVGVFGRKAAFGIDAVDEDALGAAKNVVINYPPRWQRGGMTYEEALACLSDDARVFVCGPWHPPRTRGEVVDLWSDGNLIMENAALTAEGAVAAAMRASPIALRDARCMVVGWGRIGRALTELLVALGARVTVASRTQAGRNGAAERGAEAVETGRMDRALPGCRAVFNTAPAMVLDDGMLRFADGDAMIIDLASPPYGVDFGAAWRRGLRAWREPGLPGRYCPESAAMALLRAMEPYGI